MGASTAVTVTSYSPDGCLEKFGCEGAKAAPGVEGKRLKEPSFAVAEEGVFVILSGLFA